MVILSYYIWFRSNIDIDVNICKWDMSSDQHSFIFRMIVNLGAFIAFAIQFALMENISFVEEICSFKYITR